MAKKQNLIFGLTESVKLTKSCFLVGLVFSFLRRFQKVSLSYQLSVTLYLNHSRS